MEDRLKLLTRRYQSGFQAGELPLDGGLLLRIRREVPQQSQNRVVCVSSVLVVLLLGFGNARGVGSVHEGQRNVEVGENEFYTGLIELGRLHMNSLSFSNIRGAQRHVTRRYVYFPHIHALTRICSVEYIKAVESVFEVIAEPNRRAILSLLVSSQQSVGDMERRLRMPQPMVSKHLRVLREAGFVESTVDAQRRLYRLRPEPLQEVDAWLAQFRRFWSAHVDALERHLDRMSETKPKKKARRER